MKIPQGVITFFITVIVLGASIFNLSLGVGRIIKLNTGKYEETQAVITKIEESTSVDSEGMTTTDYTITVEYTVDGKRYVSQLGETPQKFHEGMELTVLYEIDNPLEVVLPGTTGAYIMIGIGVVGLAAAAVVALNYFRGRRIVVES